MSGEVEAFDVQIAERNAGAEGDGVLFLGDRAQGGDAADVVAVVVGEEKLEISGTDLTQEMEGIGGTVSGIEQQSVIVFADQPGIDGFFFKG